MEPVTIAIVATAVFGAVTALSVFIRQLLLSRDKRLNDNAQHRALGQETRELERLRKQMEGSKRFDSHYKVLGVNKDAIQYLDQKIEDTLNKKFALIQRYSQIAIKESSAIIEKGQPTERKVVCDLLRDEIDKEMIFFDRELQQLQNRRAALWDTHSELQIYLIEQEKSRNEKLDGIYQTHTSVLEKIYIRHNESTDQVAKHTIEAGTHTLKYLMAPWQLLMKFFGMSTGIKPQTAPAEMVSRKSVADIQREINADSANDVDELSDEYLELKQLSSDLIS